MQGMKLEFPVYLIGGKPTAPVAWLKSKLDESEYLFVFTAEGNAKHFITTRIKNAGDKLDIIEVQKDELRRILETSRMWEKIVVDFGMPTEWRVPIGKLTENLAE